MATRIDNIRPALEKYDVEPESPLRKAVHDLLGVQGFIGHLENVKTLHSKDKDHALTALNRLLRSLNAVEQAIDPRKHHDVLIYHIIFVASNVVVRTNALLQKHDIAGEQVLVTMDQIQSCARKIRQVFSRRS